MFQVLLLLNGLFSDAQACNTPTILVEQHALWLKALHPRKVLITVNQPAAEGRTYENDARTSA